MTVPPHRTATPYPDMVFGQSGVGYSIPPQRRALWDRCLGRDVPRDGDLDLAFCAKAFTLSGGNIRSATLSAAYLAAAAGRPVRMPDVIAGVDREYRKLGRLRLESEFGPYQRVLTGGAP